MLSIILLTIDSGPPIDNYLCSEVCSKLAYREVVDRVLSWTLWTLDLTVTGALPIKLGQAQDKHTVEAG